MNDEWFTLQFDGGSRGNPGPSGVGVVIKAADGTTLVALGKFIGRGTNNVAEYQGLITVMQEARKLGARRIIIRGDSELVIRQMKGEYRVRDANLKVLYDQAQALLRQFEAARIEHNLRDKNELADKLANLAMDRKTDVIEAMATRKGESSSPLDEPTPVAPIAGARFACPRCGCAITLDRPSRIRPHQLKPFHCQCGTKMGEVMMDGADELPPT